MSAMGDLMIELMERYNVEDVDEVLAIQEREYQPQWVDPAEKIGDLIPDHDCHLIGGGGESGCDHPSHKAE